MNCTREQVSVQHACTVRPTSNERVLLTSASPVNWRAMDGERTDNSSARTIVTRASKRKNKESKNERRPIQLPSYNFRLVYYFLLQIPNTLEKAVIACRTHPVQSVLAAVPIEGDFGGDTSRRE